MENELLKITYICQIEKNINMLTEYENEDSMRLGLWFVKGLN